MVRFQCPKCLNQSLEVKEVYLDCMIIECDSCGVSMIEV